MTGAPPVRSGTAHTADGAELAWTVHGDGPPLLLIPGQGCTSRAWSHLLPDLAAQHTVVVFDPRGMGDSTPGDLREPTTQAFAADARAVLEAAGFTRTSVLGHSMGGRVSQWLAIAHPECVDRLVLVSTTGGDERGAPRDPAVDPLVFSPDAQAKAPLFFEESFRHAHPQVVSDFFRAEAKPRTLRGQFRASRAHDAWDALGGITATALVVHGGADAVTPPQNARMLADRIPGALLHVEPGALHCPHLDSPAARQRVLEFLAS